MNTMKQDYYHVLSIEKTATDIEIKTAYRRLTKIYHPDVAENKEEAESKFKEINEAYAVLSDPEKRRVYDQFGHEGISSNFDMNDFMGGFGFGFGDIFSQVFDMFGNNTRQSRNPNRPRRGSDLRYDIEITLEEAFKGIEKEITVETYAACDSCKGKRTKDGSSPEICNTCRGTGQVTQVTNSMLGQIMRTMPCSACSGEGISIKNPCTACSGKGNVKKPKTLKFNIPAGVDNGSKIRLTNEGESGHAGGDPGDLYIVIFVKDHKLFQRAGNDLYLFQQIRFTQAALGDEIEIPAIDGKTTLKIPAGTQCDTVIKVKDQGMPSLRGSKRGDLYVKIWIMVPTKLDDKQKDALKEFDKLTCENCYQHDTGFFEKIKQAFKRAIG